MIKIGPMLVYLNVNFTRTGYECMYVEAGKCTHEADTQLRVYAAN